MPETFESLLARLSRAGVEYLVASGASRPDLRCSFPNPMKTLLPAGPLLICALFLAACAHERPRPASGRKLQLETIRRPNRPPIYTYREVQ